MYQVGEKIIYGNSGACVIEDVALLRFGRTREQYYVLRPLYQNTSVIYVPVENADLVSRIRAIPSVEDVNAMIQEMPDTEPIWVEDAQERKAAFEEMLRSGDTRVRIRLIRSLYTYKQKRLSQGKALHVSDENVLREAQRLLYDEFATPLNLQPSQVPAYIEAQLAEK